MRMDARAQVSLETILVLAAVLLVAAWFVSSYTSTSSKAVSRAKSNSRKALEMLRKRP